MRFSASYDLTAKIVSAFVCLFLLGAVVVTHTLVVAAPLLLIILVSYAYSPRGYVIADRSITVERLASQVRIALDDIRELRRATPDDFRMAIRLWASGGLFGYYGLCRTAKLGISSWYVTNRKNSVVVITGSKTALFSPDDVEGFLNAIRASAPVPAFDPAQAWAAPRRSGALGTTLGIAIGIAAIGVVAAAMSYSPGPPNYTLTPAALTIHDRFYPVTVKPGSIEVSQIRVIDLAADQYWAPASRANGFANSHYQSGWFRLANGQKVRLYRAGGRRLVLLPSKDDVGAVLFQPADPEAVASEIRNAWSASARSSAKAGK
jgi:hypothetical protein